MRGRDERPESGASGGDALAPQEAAPRRPSRVKPDLPAEAASSPGPRVKAKATREMAESRKQIPEETTGFKTAFLGA